MAIRLGINGAAGRMGRRILSLALEDAEMEVAGAVDQAGHPDQGADAGVLAGKSPISVSVGTEFASKLDAVVDFSLPQATDSVLDYCVKNGVALVSCTTGLSESQVAKLRDASRKVAIVRASNMSVGMNVLFALVGKVGQMLGEEYDVEIVEAHHRFKKDAPSGTALTLAENVARETVRDYPGCLTQGRSGKDALREKGTIGMHAVRGGDIVGDHSVIFSALGETVTLSHRAHSRDTFAAGALRAAKWLVGKEPGLYSMADVLGLNQPVR